MKCLCYPLETWTVIVAHLSYTCLQITLRCDLLSQHLECAAANGNVGGISIEGFAFSITYWNPKTKNESEENSSALLCIRLWPMSNSKDRGLISQFCTCTPANLFNICSDKCVGIWGLDSDLKLIFLHQLGVDKWSMIITLIKQELYLWNWKKCVWREQSQDL